MTKLFIPGRNSKVNISFTWEVTSHLRNYHNYPNQEVTNLYFLIERYLSTERGYTWEKDKSLYVFWKWYFWGYPFWSWNFLGVIFIFWYFLGYWSFNPNMSMCSTILYKWTPWGSTSSISNSKIENIMEQNIFLIQMQYSWIRPSMVRMFYIWILKHCCR